MTSFVRNTYKRCNLELLGPLQLTLHLTSGISVKNISIPELQGHDRQLQLQGKYEC